MFKSDKEQIQKSYEAAKKVYAAYGVDTDKAIEIFNQIPIALHNWQGDDVTGFEKNGDVVSQNLVTGNYPGRARNGKELRTDIETAFSFSPVKPRVNIHSMYGEPGTTPRNKLTVEDFRLWIDWAKKNKYVIDFNVSFFTHPMMNNGFSLACHDKKTRDFWIEAGKGGRQIANDIGKELGETCINDILKKKFLGSSSSFINLLIIGQIFVAALHLIGFPFLFSFSKIISSFKDTYSYYFKELLFPPPKSLFVFS
jgi:L-rhamnose isomerase